MRQLFISLLAVAVIMASCSKSEQDSPAASRDGVIHAFAGIDTPSTKAVVLKENGVSGVAFRLIHAAAEPADFSVAGTETYTGDIAATGGTGGGAVTFLPAAEYEQTNDWNAWFIGYYPAGASVNNIVTWTIDGQTDVLLTESVWDAGKYSAPKSTGMSFQHQLSQIEVICQAQGGVALSAVQAAWGQIKSISFVDAPASMAFNYATLTVSTGTTLVDMALLADYNGTPFSAIKIPVSNNATKNAVAMLAPVAAMDAAKSFQLKIVTEGATADPADDITSTVHVKVGAATAEAMSKGKTHKVTLTFKIDGKNIEVTQATIQDWTAGSDATGDVEKPTP